MAKAHNQRPKPAKIIVTKSPHSRAERHLKKADPLLAQVIKRVGPCEMRYEPDAWRALSSSIIGQQISTHAARAIRGRFAALSPDHEFPPPAYILELDDETMRAVGLSANKTRSLRDLAQHFVDGAIAPEKFPAMSDEEIITSLIPVRGIGRWTSEMFLLFSLQRPDILAVDDLGATQCDAKNLRPAKATLTHYYARHRRAVAPFSERRLLVSVEIAG